MQLAKTQGNDPNVGMLTYASPLNANELENEASGLRNQLIAQLFQQECVFQLWAFGSEEGENRILRAYIGGGSMTPAVDAGSQPAS
jgi:hypothetical protein